MKRQKNIAQITEQNKTPQKEINKMETSNVLDAEFKTLVIRMLSDFTENFNSIKKDMETIKKNQSEMKNILTKMKNNLQGLNSRVDEAKNQISNLKYMEAKNTQSEQQEKRIQKNEDSINSLWDNFKRS